MPRKKRDCRGLSCAFRGRSQKKGAAHIEMVASFILFFTFVLFMILIIKPYEITSVSGSVVPRMYDQFESMTITNLTNVFLKANLTAPGSCLFVTLPNQVFAYGFTESIVTNLADEDISSSLENSRLEVGSPSLVYYKVAISPDFNNSASLGSCVEVTDYILGSVLERQIISEKNLLLLKERYFADYDSLRQDLGIPGDTDFAITSEDLPRIDMMTVSPTGPNRYTVEYLAEVLLTNGTIVNARFLLWNW